MRGRCKRQLATRSGRTRARLCAFVPWGVRFMIDGETTEGRFSLVEHPLPPRALGAPLHTHRNEDEYSYVLEGRIGECSSVTRCSRQHLGS
jgi:mannose-6-phosphate isomerase-like protein (cupin superfamily)